MSQKVSIVTVVYNAINEFELLVNSINLIDWEEIELVVVFNGNVNELDVVKKILMKRSFKIQLIVTDNLGFAHGCNVGVNHSKNELIWLLNSDCELTEGSLRTMVNKLNSNPMSIVGSKIVLKNGGVQCYGGGYLNFTIGYQKQARELSELDYITGASMLLTKLDYLKIGMMDEKYFLYWEETDFCMKAKLLGFKFVVAERSLIYHTAGASTDIKSLFTEYYSTRNAIAFFKEYSSHTQLFVVVLCNLTLKISNRIIRGQFSRIPTLLYAIYDGLVGKMGLSTRV